MTRDELERIMQAAHKNAIYDHYLRDKVVTLDDLRVILERETK